MLREFRVSGLTRGLGGERSGETTLAGGGVNGGCLVGGGGR